MDTVRHSLSRPQAARSDRPLWHGYFSTRTGSRLLVVFSPSFIFPAEESCHERKHRPPNSCGPLPLKKCLGALAILRDDIKDLRTQIGALHERIDETNRSLGDRIDETNKRIDETNRSLGERIDETNRSLGEQIRALHKRMDTYFLWMMGTLVAITSVLIAVIKL